MLDKPHTSLNRHSTKSTSGCKNYFCQPLDFRPIQQVCKPAESNLTTSETQSNPTETRSSTDFATGKNLSGGCDRNLYVTNDLCRAVGLAAAKTLDIIASWQRHNTRQGYNLIDGVHWVRMTVHSVVEYIGDVIGLGQSACMKLLKRLQRLGVLVACKPHLNADTPNHSKYYRVDFEAIDELINPRVSQDSQLLETSELNELDDGPFPSIYKNLKNQHLEGCPGVVKSEQSKPTTPVEKPILVSPEERQLRQEVTALKAKAISLGFMANMFGPVLSGLTPKQQVDGLKAATDKAKVKDLHTPGGFIFKFLRDRAWLGQSEDNRPEFEKRIGRLMREKNIGVGQFPSELQMTVADMTDDQRQALLSWLESGASPPEPIPEPMPEPMEPDFLDELLDQMGGLSYGY